MQRPAPFLRLTLLGVGLLGVCPVAADELGVELQAVARVGSRPEECGGGARTRVTRWDRAKLTGLGPYCDALARGYASLAEAPGVALEAAAAAESALPGRAPALVLEARAQVAVGAWGEGWSRFERARSLSPRSVESPLALHDLAVCAEKTGHRAEALAAYRALIVRASFFDDDRRELTVLVEAAVLTMSQGPEHIAEAIGYLTEARRRGSSLGRRGYVLAALALALDRQGTPAEARAVASEAAGPQELEAERRRPEKARPDAPLLPAGELDALIAILAEGRDRELAIQRWGSFLESPSGKTGPFAAHARAHREALGRSVPGKR